MGERYTIFLLEFGGGGGGGYKIFLLEYGGRGGKGWGAVSGPDQNMVFTAQLRD